MVRALRLAGLVLVLLLVRVVPAHAAPLDPDTEVARRHFERGRDLYEQGKYAEAIIEFEAARDLRDLPQFDYNIGRASERLGDWAKAVKVYDRYLERAPKGAERDELLTRVEVLRIRAAKQAGPQPAAPTSSRPPARSPFRIPALSLAVVTVVIAAAGTGVYLSPLSAYNAKQSDCAARACVEADVTSLRSKVEVAQIAGGTLLGLAAAALIADVALWVVDARHRRRAPATASPSLPGAGWSF